MRWSKAQKDLIDLARERVARGYCSVDVVVDENESGVADEQLEHVVRHVEGACTDPRWDGPLNLKLAANRHWDAVCSLSQKAGTRGNGYLERIFNALRALKAQGHKHLTLWLAESRQLGITDQEGLAFLLAYGAENVGIKLRIIYMTGLVYRYIPERRCKGHVKSRKEYRQIIADTLRAGAQDEGRMFASKQNRLHYYDPARKWVAVVDAPSGQVVTAFPLDGPWAEYRRRGK